MAQNQVAEKQPVKMSIADIKGMLNNGLDRRAIAKHYGVSLATMKRVFDNPALKGLRVKPTVPVILVDEAGVETALGTSAPVAAEVAAAPVAQTTATTAETPAQATEAVAPAAPVAAAQPVQAAAGTNNAETAEKGLW